MFDVNLYLAYIILPYQSHPLDMIYIEFSILDFQFRCESFDMVSMDINSISSINNHFNRINR